jgi:CubicO group peptidase (beta-lactamase class C family)
MFRKDFQAQPTPTLHFPRFLRDCSSALIPILALVCLVIAATPARAALHPVVPEQVGISSERLARIDQAFGEMVNKERIPGITYMILRDGKQVRSGAIGFRDREKQLPMEDVTMFRIASMTKIVVSAAILMLQEDGLLLINDPVGKYLPEFQNTSVAEDDGTGGYRIVPARRAITIRDLLTHTAGLGYGEGPAKALWEKAGLSGWYFADKEETIRDCVLRMASLPFDAHPGERFVYGYGTDVLGALIEVVTGMNLDRFLKQRLFDPLGMGDTHFFVPTEKASRLATVYAHRNGRLTRNPDGAGRINQGNYVEGPRRCLSGGAGLVSTAKDYARFLQMLLDQGEWEGKRLLSRKSVELMCVDHMPSGVSFPWVPGVGFGLGVSVVEDLGLRGELGSVGEFGWGGAYRTMSFVDPVERLVVVYMTQMIPVENLNDHGLFRTLLYQAILD